MPREHHCSFLRQLLEVFPLPNISEASLWRWPVTESTVLLTGQTIPSICNAVLMLYLTNNQIYENIK